LRQGRGLYRKLSQLSHRDTVSGLYNRPYFLARLERALVATAANAQPVAIMLIAWTTCASFESQDVAAADEVVEQAAKRLQAAWEPTRSRPDLAMLSSRSCWASPIRRRCSPRHRRCRPALETDPYRLAGGDFPLRTSIGISIANPCVREAAVLIQQADLACGMARDSKDTRIHVHHAPERRTGGWISPQQRHCWKKFARPCSNSG
jgi:GGDEF domain-containing protein